MSYSMAGTTKKVSWTLVEDGDDEWDFHFKPNRKLKAPEKYALGILNSLDLPTRHRLHGKSFQILDITDARSGLPPCYSLVKCLCARVKVTNESASNVSVPAQACHPG